MSRPFVNSPLKSQINSIANTTYRGASYDKDTTYCRSGKAKIFFKGLLYPNPHQTTKSQIFQVRKYVLFMELHLLALRPLSLRNTFRQRGKNTSTSDEGTNLFLVFVILPCSMPGIGAHSGSHVIRIYLARIINSL